MTALTIAAAQTTAIAGDIAANLARHLHFMQVAADHGVELLVFPELSLTGYELALARDLAFQTHDERLRPLREQAQRTGMTTVVGVPLRQSDTREIVIAALVLGGDGSVDIYSKKHLHAGEDKVFSPGRGGPLLTIHGQNIALAVCADFSQPSHPREAAAMGADIYAAGVLISENGYATDSALLAGYAAEHRMAVLMANHGGVTGGWQSAGRSALWDANGTLIAATPGAGETLLIGRKETPGWSAQIIEIAGV